MVIDHLSPNPDVLFEELDELIQHIIIPCKHIIV
jgi:hypothetical protein